MKGSAKKSEMNRSTLSEDVEMVAGITAATVKNVRQASAIEPGVSKKKKKEDTPVVAVNGLLNNSLVMPKKEHEEIVAEGKITPIKTLEVNSGLPTAPTSERKSPKSAERKRVSPPITKVEAVKEIIKEKV